MSGRSISAARAKATKRFSAAQSHRRGRVGSTDAPGDLETPGSRSETAIGSGVHGVTVQVVGQASRPSTGRRALGATNAGGTPGAAGGTPAPLPEMRRSD